MEPLDAGRLRAPYRRVAMPKPPPKNTALGLGRATTSTAPPASVEVRRRDSRAVDRPRPARRTTLAWEAQPEAVTAMHPRPREGRAALKVDDVGEAAAKLAR